MTDNDPKAEVDSGRHINVLHLISSFNQGGSEKQAIQLAGALSKANGFNVFLASLRDEGSLRPWANELGFVDPPVFRVRSFYSSSFVREVARFRRFLKSENIDIVHCHDFYTNVFGIVAQRTSGARVTIASKRETSGTRSPAQSFVEKQLFKFATTIVANSQAVSEFLIKRGVPGRSIEVIYNGVEIDRFEREFTDREEIISTLGLPNSPNVRFVTLLANLHLKVKNQSMLLRAADRILASHPDTHFIIAGEGRLKDDLERHAAELQIRDHVHFIGHCSNVPDLLRISFAGVLTSTAEGFSNAILEYMAAALPVVATNVGGAREVIADGESGFVVPVNDPDALADRVIWLLDNVSIAEEMGMRGREIVHKQFSPDAQVKKTAEVYNRLMHGSSGR